MNNGINEINDINNDGVPIFGGKYRVFKDGRVVSYVKKESYELKGKITKGGYRMLILYDEKGKDYIGMFIES